MCARPLKKHSLSLSRERLAHDDETRFLRSTKIHRAIPIKEPTVQVSIARKKHPNKRSKKNLDGIYEVLQIVQCRVVLLILLQAKEVERVKNKFDQFL